MRKVKKKIGRILSGEELVQCLADERKCLVEFQEKFFVELKVKKKSNRR